MKCKCGCGKPTKKILKNHRKLGRVKGKYSKFIVGHNLGIQTNPMENLDSVNKIKQKTIERYKDEEYCNKHKKACKDYYKTHKHHIKGKPKLPSQKLKMSISKIKWYENNPEKAKLKAVKVSETKKRKGYWKGKKNPNWQDGKSFEPYGLEFNKELKEKIKKRDNYECQYCHKKQKDLLKDKWNRKIKLATHHIDYNKKNNNPLNLISLCPKCHNKTNYNREFWKRYFTMYQFIRFNSHMVLDHNYIEFKKEDFEKWEKSLRGMLLPDAQGIFTT